MPAPGALASTIGRRACDAAVKAATACASEWMRMTGSVKISEIGRHLDHTVRKAPFVVVPRQDAHETLVEHLRLRHIEGRAVWVVVEVDRDGRRPVDAENASEAVRARRLLHQRVDLLGRGV